MSYVFVYTLIKKLHFLTSLRIAIIVKYEGQQFRCICPGRLAINSTRGKIQDKAPHGTLCDWLVTFFCFIIHYVWSSYVSQLS